MSQEFDSYHILINTILMGQFQADPEWVHHRVMALLAQLDRSTPGSLPGRLRSQLQQWFCRSYPALEQSLWGLRFANPLGLGAGFDKDAQAVGIWPDLGFGFTEVGTVTWHPQPGNPKPRLFRLPADRAILNRMGFNNQGALALANRLGHHPQRQLRSHPLGINLGKSKITPLEAAAEDYRQSFQALYAQGDYFVVNVSSPNTPGLRSLQAVAQLEPILASLQAHNPQAKPLLIKISTDLDWEDIAAMLHLAQAYQLAGVIATNTTTTRNGLTSERIPKTGTTVQTEAGGLSGAPLRQRATDVIRFIAQQTQQQWPIIGVGGIFTVEDAWEKITAGASLLQLYTGWIYQGPWLVPTLLAGLEQKLKERGLTTIQQAVGLNVSTRV